MTSKQQPRICFVSELIIRRKKTRESLFIEIKYGKKDFFFLSSGISFGTGWHL